MLIVDIPTISQHHLELKQGVELPAVEALDVGVLRRLAGVVDQVLDAFCAGAGHEGLAHELQPLVGPDGQGIASDLPGMLKEPSDVLGADAVVDRDLDALPLRCFPRTSSYGDFRHRHLESRRLAPIIPASTQQMRVLAMVAWAA